MFCVTDKPLTEIMNNTGTSVWTKLLLQYEGQGMEF